MSSEGQLKEEGCNMLHLFWRDPNMLGLSKVGGYRTGVVSKSGGLGVLVGPPGLEPGTVRL